MAQAYGALSQFRQQEAAASGAAEKAVKQGATLWAAQAIESRAIALQDLGRGPEAAAAYAEGVRAFSLAGNRKSVEKCLNAMATLADGLGDYPRARKLYERAAQISREIGYQFGVAAALSNISELLSDQGDYAGAEKGRTRFLGGQTLTLCRLPALGEGGRPRKTMVCPTKVNRRRAARPGWAKINSIAG